MEMTLVNILKFLRSFTMENQLKLTPVSLIFVIYFPAEFFEFSFNTRCKI